MTKKFFPLFFLGVFMSLAMTYAEEDSAYEKRIHNIYLKHYKEPVSNSDWNSLIQNLPPRHKLKFKDNMWDLSGSFFKNPLYWSKMWVVNPQVENPHLIYQGNFLKLDPQALATVNSSKYSVDIQSQFPGLEIPKNEQARKSLRESEIPSSLPKLLSWRDFNTRIDISKIHGIEPNKQAIVPSFLTGSAPSADGEVISKDGYGDSISIGGEQLVIRVNGDTNIGSVFTVFENKGRIGSLFQFVAGLNEDEVVIKGRIRVLSFLQGSDSLYTASVIEALDKIKPGDSLLQGEPPAYNFSQKGPMGSGNGLIIGSPVKDQNMLGPGSIVYLNKGSSDGIQKGKIFYIRANTEKSQAWTRPYPYKQPILGKLKIIHSADTTSTGIIVESKNQIHIGDLFTGSFDIIDDLDESIEHERIEEDKEEKDLLIDVEETEETEEETEEEEAPKIKNEELEDFEIMEEDEEGLGEDEAKDTELEMEFEDEMDDEFDEEAEEEAELEVEFDEEAKELEDFNGDIEDLEEAPEDEDFELIEEAEDTEIEFEEEELDDEFDEEMEEETEEEFDEEMEGGIEKTEEEEEPDLTDFEELEGFEDIEDFEEAEEPVTLEDEDFESDLEEEKSEDQKLQDQFEENLENEPESELEEFEELDIL